MPPKAKKVKISKKTSFLKHFSPNLIKIRFFKFFLIFLIFLIFFPTKKFKSHLQQVETCQMSLHHSALLPACPPLSRLMTFHPNLMTSLLPCWPTEYRSSLRLWPITYSLGLAAPLGSDQWESSAPDCEKFSGYIRSETWGFLW